MYMYADGLGLAVWGGLTLLLAGCAAFWAVNQWILWRQAREAGHPRGHGLPRLSVKVRLVWPEEAANDNYETPQAA